MDITWLKFIFESCEEEREFYRQLNPLKVVGPCNPGSYDFDDYIDVNDTDVQNV